MTDKSEVELNDFGNTANENDIEENATNVTNAEEDVTNSYGQYFKIGGIVLIVLALLTALAIVIYVVNEQGAAENSDQAGGLLNDSHTYTLSPFGMEYTSESLNYIKKSGKFISAWHDIPLVISNNQNGLVHMVVEIPVGETGNYKMNIRQNLNPLTIASQNGALQSVPPWNGAIQSFGYLPQSWDNPFEIYNVSNTVGNSAPLDAIDISGIPAKRGEVKLVKILSSFGLKKPPTTDWKVIVVDLRYEHANVMNSVEDINYYKPGLLFALKEYFRTYPLFEGRPEGELLFDSEFRSQSFSISLVNRMYDFWRVGIKGDESMALSLGTAGLASTEIKDSRYYKPGESPNASLLKPFSANTAFIPPLAVLMEHPVGKALQLLMQTTPFGSTLLPSAVVAIIDDNLDHSEGLKEYTFNGNSTSAGISTNNTIYQYTAFIKSSSPLMTSSTTFSAGIYHTATKNCGIAFTPPNIRQNMIDRGYEIIVGIIKKNGLYHITTGPTRPILTFTVEGFRNVADAQISISDLPLEIGDLMSEAVVHAYFKTKLEQL